MDSAVSGRASHERDFLEELQRQREQVVQSPFTSPVNDDEVAAVAAAAPRVERSVGEPAASKARPAYDADDLEIPSFLRRK